MNGTERNVTELNGTSRNFTECETSKKTVIE